MIVVMLKNKATGFLESELGSYSVAGENLIYNIFAIEEDSKVNVHIRLTTERDLADWEFSAVFDYYDMEPVLELCSSALEDDSGYNPIWEVTLEFSASHDVMQQRLSQILETHKNELDSVYDAIKDLEEEYSKEE